MTGTCFWFISVTNLVKDVKDAEAGKIKEKKDVNSILRHNDANIWEVSND